MLCKIMKRSFYVAHDTEVISSVHLNTTEEERGRANCDPEPHQEKAEVQRVEKRKEITVGKKKQWKESLEKEV